MYWHQCPEPDHPFVFTTHPLINRVLLGQTSNSFRLPSCYILDNMEGDGNQDSYFTTGVVIRQAWSIRGSLAGNTPLPFQNSKP